MTLSELIMKPNLLEWTNDMTQNLHLFPRPTYILFKLYLDTLMLTNNFLVSDMFCIYDEMAYTLEKSFLQRFYNNWI